MVRPLGSDFNNRSQFAKYFETFRSLLAYSSPLVASTACKVPSSRISVLSEAESKVRGLQDVASPRWPVTCRCSVRFTRPSPRCLRSGPVNIAASYEMSASQKAKSCPAPCRPHPHPPPRAVVVRTIYAKPCRMHQNVAVGRVHMVGAEARQETPLTDSRGHAEER